MGGQLAINALIAAAGYGLAALSFALVSRTARFFHVAHGVVFTLGAYATLELMAIGLYFPVAAAGGIVAAALGGLLMEWAVFHRLRSRGSSPETQLLASFGLLIVLQNGIALLWGDARRPPFDHQAMPGINLAGAYVTEQQIAAIALSSIAAIGIIFVLRRSTLGLALRAVGENPALSRARGVRVDRTIIAAFIIGSAAMGLAGVLQAADTGLTPLMGYRALLVAFAGAVIGGLDSDLRAWAGGVLIGVLEQVGAFYLPGQWYQSVILAILVIALLLRGRSLIEAQGPPR